MAWLTNLLSSTFLPHLLGIIALTVLMALGTLSVSVGLPLLAALIGVGIPSTIGTGKTGP